MFYILVVTLALYQLLYCTAYFPSFNVPYCHHDFSTRDIPQLKQSELAQVKSLVQVQVVVRHGARWPCPTNFRRIF